VPFRQSHFFWIGLICSLAALTGAAFFLLSPGTLFSLTGEENLQAQMRAVIQWAFHWTRPQPQTANDLRMRYQELPPFGVNTFLEQEVEPAKRERSLQMISEAGFRWIRQPFAWSDIEIHGKGDFEDRRNDPPRSAWEKYDQIIDMAEKYDLEIIARLGAPPNWSRADGNARGDFAPPDNFEDFADFAETIARRYQGRLHYYQIWNEPNIYPEWGNQTVDPEAYTQLLCLTYQRIKAVDPEAVIISGAMAPTDQLGTPNSQGGNNLMDGIFLQRMYDAGAQPCFDVMALNNYMLWSGPTDRRMRPQLINFSRPEWIRDLMVANGDAAKPIWISEMNSNVVPESLPANFGRVTEEQQARYAVAAYERIQQEWPWAGVTTVWFFKRASDAEKDQAWYYFRLVEPDFTPLPVYTSLKDYLTQLPPTLYAGRHPANTWQLTYHGEWKAHGENRIAETEAGLTLIWEGQNLILHTGTQSGKLYYTTADGQSKEISLTGAPVSLPRLAAGGPQTLTLKFDPGIELTEIEIR